MKFTFDNDLGDSLKSEVYNSEEFTGPFVGEVSLYCGIIPHHYQMLPDVPLALSNAHSLANSKRLRIQERIESSNR